MKKRINRIEPLQAGKVFAITQALFSLVFVLPFALLGGLAALFSQSVSSNSQGFHQAAHNVNPAFGLIFGGVGIILLPLLYGIMGFLFGVIGAFVYNLVASWTGGIEFVVTDVQTDSVLPKLPPNPY